MGRIKHNITKFEVVHTNPEALLKNFSSGNLEAGKLYFATGAAKDGVGQGLYMYETDDSSFNEGEVNLSLIGAGSIADEKHAGLLSARYFTKLQNLPDITTTSYEQSLASKADSSHNHNYSNLYTGENTAGKILVSSSDGSFELKNLSSQRVSEASTANYAEHANIANTSHTTEKLSNTFDISAGGNQIIVFDGSVPKTLTIKNGNNISIEGDTSGNVTISATDTIYEGENGIYISNNKIGHTNTIDASDNSVGAQTLSWNSTVNIPYVSYDEYGHIKGKSMTTLTIPENPNTDELWLTNASTDKVYITGKKSNINDRSVGFVNSSVWMESGSLYSDGKKVATEEYVALQAGSVFSFKGNITAISEILSPKNGYSYRNSSTGNLNIDATNSITGTAEIIEPGDLIICVDSSTPKYMIVDNNIENNVSFSSTPEDTKIVIFDGNQGAIKSSGKSISDIETSISNKADASHKHAYTDLNSVGTSDANKMLTTDVSGNFKLIDKYSYTHPTAGSGTVYTPTNSSTATTFLTRVSIDSSGHIKDTSAFNGTVGSTTQPVYFNAGIPTILEHTIAKSVPSDAVFTDTKLTTSASTAKLFLVGKTDASKATTSTAHYNASAYVDGSGYLYSGGSKVLTDESYKGTVTSITPGIGLTGSYTDSAITSSGTINLKPTNMSELGGIIASNVLTTSVSLTSANSSTTSRYYGVQVDKDGKAFVNIPWTDNNVTNYSTTSGKIYILGQDTQGTTTTTKTYSGCYITNKCIYSNDKLVATVEDVSTAQEAATVYWEVLTA